MLVVGLTGGIASGKSTVSRILEQMGAEIVDADCLVHEITGSGSKALEQIIDVFGAEYLKPDRSLDRRKLGRLVFNDPGAMARLNAIVHPAVIEIIRRTIDSRRESAVPPEVLVVDAPLLIEAGMVPLVDVVWVVKVSQDIQVDRLLARDHLSMSEALARIKAQMPLEDKIKYADVVIDNSGTLEDTARQVRQNLGRGAIQSNG